jgi:hypothetical protein
VNPTGFFETDVGIYQGWKGAGWYWIDPEFLAGRTTLKSVTGPYKFREAAEIDYYAYCEVMVG